MGELSWLQVFNTCLILGLITYKIYSDWKWRQQFEKVEVKVDAALDISKGHATLTEKQQCEITQVVDTVKKVVSESGGDSGKLRIPPEIKLPEVS